jgi:hypothetical protein
MLYFQWISFIFLALVSSFFTYNLAIELGTSTLEKVALIGGSLAIEVLKLYCLVAANTAREVVGKWPKVVGLYMAYGFVALYSLLASFGYAVSTVDRVGARVAVVSKEDDIKLEKQNLSLMDDAITNTQKAIIEKRTSISQLGEDKLARKLELQKLIQTDQQTINGYMSKRVEIQTHITDLTKEDRTQQSFQKRTMYEVIGDTVGMSSKWVAFWVLAIFAMSIEIGIFVTSPHQKPLTPKAVAEEGTYPSYPPECYTLEPEVEVVCEDPGDNPKSTLRGEVGGKRRIQVEEPSTV